MSHESGCSLDHAVLSAWQAELNATRDPSIKQQCLEQESELLPRFAEHYQQLKALRGGCGGACKETGGIHRPG